MHALLTGGAGYVGIHTAVELVANGHDVTIVDNFSNSSPEAVKRAEKLSGRAISLVELDLMDDAGLTALFNESRFDAVVHFAGLKAVGESVTDPLRYYETNLGCTFNLLRQMIRTEVPRLVFSSSATVYGKDAISPITENTPLTDAASPYGRTKLMIERVLEDVASAHSFLGIVRLRYFNPAGAHPSGEIGEDPAGIPNNLMPFVTQVAVGTRTELTINGDDYPTPDGTCIRDYIHVVDLAGGHLAALRYIENRAGLWTFNLGTGRGSSVKEVIHTFEEANQITLPKQTGPRRPGDVPTSFTDPGLAASELGWQAEKTLEDICRDAWRWQQKNPNGYR